MALRFRTSSPESSSTEQAAAWYARHRSGPLSEADEARFAAWLKTDAANVTAWKEFGQLWARVEAVRDDPTILALREAARRRMKARPSVPRAWGTGAALVASVVLGVAIWWGLRGSVPQPTRPPEPSLVRYASTEIGERSILVLLDGSKVTLNTASAVRADYTGPERRVTVVRGEAFFNVAKDPTRPFIVSARSREVIAVGTAFDVRLQPQQLRVTLVEGKVRVVPASSAAIDAAVKSALPVTLEAGMALVASDDGVNRIEKDDALRATSWLSGKLVFEDERLADVVAEMNRYCRQKLEIATAALGERKVSGVFDATDAGSLAKGLQDYGIARLTQQSATRIVLDSPSNSHSKHNSVPP